MSSWRLVRMRMKRTSSCIQTGSPQAHAKTDGATHGVARVAADLLEPRLHALDDPRDGVRVPAPLFSLEDDTRVPDDGRGLSPREQHVAQDRAVRRQRREDLFHFGRWAHR